MTFPTEPDAMTIPETMKTLKTSNSMKSVNTMKTTTILRTMSLLLGLVASGCGPTFDPGSLITKTRVVGARVEVTGAPDRAMPKPGESASVTWLVTGPEQTPPLSWAFALCAPGTVGGKSTLSCSATPLALFQGTATPPRVSIAVPSADALAQGGATSLLLYGEICAGAGSTLTFDPVNGIPTCVGGSAGTTASVSIPLQLGDEANHNPTVDRAFTFDGQEWAPLAAGADPCVAGPRVAPGTEGHVLGALTAATDRETYTTTAGDPPVATSVRETLQVSQFTTAGELKSQFSFVDDPAATGDTTVAVKWKAPKSSYVPATGLPVTFTFVVRDDRGGTDWTTRAACVRP